MFHWWSIVHCRNFSFDIIDVGGLKCFTFTFYLTSLMSVVLKLSDIWSVSLKMIGLWPPPHNKTVSGKKAGKVKTQVSPLDKWTVRIFLRFKARLSKPSCLEWSRGVCVLQPPGLPIYSQFLPNLFSICIKLTLLSISFPCGSHFLRNEFLYKKSVSFNFKKYVKNLWKRQMSIR